MDKLPVELLQHVLNLLDTPALLNTIRVNYLCYLTGTACLFSDITFYADPYTGDLTSKSTQLLTQLYWERDVKHAALKRIHFVRRVSLLPSPQPRFRVTPHAFSTLSMVFFQILRNRPVQSSLRAFVWRLGCSQELGRIPLGFPQHLQVLECVACQINSSVFFPALKSLSLRQMQDTDGEWVSRQIQHSNLQRLCVGGISNAARITMSGSCGLADARLGGLEYLDLEYVHLDIWPVPPTARLKELTLKYCSHSSSLYRACKRNLPTLEALTIISEQDVHVRAMNEFKRMLWSCKQIKTLVLLLAGRTSNIPLSWIRPMYPSLENLILDARLFVITPTMSYKYTLQDVSIMSYEMPKLKVLGLSIDMEQEERSAVCATHMLPFQQLTHTLQTPLPPPLKLQALHVRNWLHSQQIAHTLDRLINYFCQDQSRLPCHTVLILAGGQCYKVSDAHSIRPRADRSHSAAVQIDDAPYRQHAVSWT
jgi:hypothetical protein